MALVDDFLTDLDRRWSPTGSEKIVLHVIGSTALMLRTGYERGTKDSDVLETAALTDDIKDRLRALAGKDTALHARHGLYLDIVSQAIPFLPQRPLLHPLPKLNATLRHFSVEVLDVVDVVVTKLKRFNSADASDIKAMVDRSLVDHRTLVERFRSAVDMFSGEARAEDLPRYVRHLHRVERDYLLVEESKIDLPDWIA